MLSNSRFQDQCAYFLSNLSQISDDVYSHYFSPTGPPAKRFLPRRSLMQEYTLVYDFCTSKPAYEEKMFELFKRSLHQHLLKHMPVLEKCENSADLIRSYNLIWESYKSFALILTNKVFAYLNRYYIPANDHDSLAQVSINIFITIYFTDNKAKAFLSAYCEELAAIRKSKVIDNIQLLKFSISIATLDEKKLSKLLNQIYLGESKKFYELSAEQHRDSDPMTYITFVNNLYYFEKLLSERSILLNQEERSELNSIFNAALVKGYTRSLLAAPYGFSYLLRTQKLDKLKIVGSVYERLEGYEDLKVALYDFILQEGQVRLNTLHASDSHTQFINAFYEFKGEYSKLVMESFNRNEEMRISLNNALEKVVSKYEKMPTVLFKFTRELLDKGRFEEGAEKVIEIFEKLSYKDEFLNLYKASLEDKILRGPLIYSIEKRFIQTMHTICGSDLTAQLEKMLEDSVESMPNELVPTEPNFSVKVVALHYWEKRFDEQVTLNLTLAKPLDAKWSHFEQLYSAHFPKRKLTLMPYETKVVLRVIHDKKEVDLKCNLIQACIILHSAAQQKCFTEDELIMNLTLEKNFVQRFLEEIPLIKAGSEPGLYQFDWQYEGSEAVVDLDSRAKEERKVTKNVEQDREIIIQAAIMKSLKRTKQMIFGDLIKEVHRRIKLFKPHPSNVKSAMEVLIKKEMVKFGESGHVEYIE